MQVQNLELPEVSEIIGECAGEGVEAEIESNERGEITELCRDGPGEAVVE